MSAGNWDRRLKIPAPPYKFTPNPSHEGWTCPVCKMGNAPFAMKCGHCDDERRRKEAKK